MTEPEIRAEYTKRAIEIESHYLEMHVPLAIRELYLLVELIHLRSVEKYICQFGWEPIDASLAQDGKELMKWGLLSKFERDCITFLNEEVESREHGQKRPALTLPASSVRVLA